METFSLQWKTEARWEEGLLWRQQHYNKNTTHHKQTQQNYTSDDNLKTLWETYVKSINHYRMKNEERKTKQNKTNERKKRTYLNKDKKENRFRSSITFESFSPSLFLVALKVCFEKEFVFFSTTFSFFFFLN